MNGFKKWSLFFRMVPLCSFLFLCSCDEYDEFDAELESMELEDGLLVEEPYDELEISTPSGGKLTFTQFEDGSLAVHGLESMRDRNPESISAFKTLTADNFGEFYFKITGKTEIPEKVIDMFNANERAPKLQKGDVLAEERGPNWDDFMQDQTDWWFRDFMPASTFRDRYCYPTSNNWEWDTCHTNYTHDYDHVDYLFSTISHLYVNDNENIREPVSHRVNRYLFGTWTNKVAHGVGPGWYSYIYYWAQFGQDKIKVHAWHADQANYHQAIYKSN